jgi:hypothetical protein
MEPKDKHNGYSLDAGHTVKICKKYSGNSLDDVRE